MNCPKCGAELVEKYYKGMLPVDACPNCRGMWLDLGELDRLEDVVFDDDAHKGSLIHREAETQFPCPHCGERLHEFQYRLYDLRLDYCAVNGHGFWLDAGEEARVVEIMQKRAAEVQRKVNAEREWRGLLKKMHNHFKGLK
jgi:hypothetical protein